MKQLAILADWDIDDAGGTGKVWRIYEGNTAPLLRSFLTALSVTANDATTTYSGNAYSGGNVAGYSVAGAGSSPNLLGSPSYGGMSQGATNVGSYTITLGGLYFNQRGYAITVADVALTIAPAPSPVSPAAPASSTPCYVAAQSAVYGRARQLPRCPRSYPSSMPVCACRKGFE